MSLGLQKYNNVLSQLADELNTIRGGEQVTDDTDIEVLVNSSSSVDRSELIQNLQDSINDKESELTRSRKEQQQMNTVIQAMRDERGRLQRECLELRAQLPSLERKNKEREGTYLYIPVYLILIRVQWGLRHI